MNRSYFSNEPIVAVCGTGYEAPEEMTLSELMRYRIIVRERHAGARRILEHKLAEQGYTLDHFPARYEVGSLSAVKGLACRDCGIAFFHMKHQFQKETWQTGRCDASSSRISPSCTHFSFLVAQRSAVSRFIHTDIRQ